MAGLETPFNELFADVAAAAFHRDPSAIARALATTSHGPETCSTDKDEVGRDFDGAVDAAEWTDVEPHNQLAPVRSVIGARYGRLLASSAPSTQPRPVHRSRNTAQAGSPAAGGAAGSGPRPPGSNRGAPGLT